MNSKRQRQSSRNARAKRPRSGNRVPHHQAPMLTPVPAPVPRDVIANEIQSLALTKWHSTSAASDPSLGTDLCVLVYRQYITATNSNSALAALGQQQYFQLYLWPEFCRLIEKFRAQNVALDWAILQPFTLSIATLFNYRQDHHPARATGLLDTFDQNPDAVSALIESFFRLDLSTLSSSERCVRVAFLCHAFRALDHESIKNALLPLLSLPVWIHLSDEAREVQVQRFPYLRKPLSKLKRRAKQRDDGKESPLPELAVISLVRELESEVLRCALQPFDCSLAITTEILSLFAELLSQLRLRRTLLPLLCDRSTLPLVQGLSMELSRDASQCSSELFSDWLRVLDLFAYYVTFPLDPATGTSVSRDSIRAERARRLLALQRISHALCERKNLLAEHSLRKLPMGNHSLVGSAETLRSVFGDCEEHILDEILVALGMAGLRSTVLVTESDVSLDEVKDFRKRLLVSAVASHCALQKDVLESFRSAPLMTTEQDLWGPLGANESRSSAALPVLNLDFLNVSDYILRNFALYKWESSWAIREDIEDAIVRMQPSFDEKGVSFAGWAKMAAPITSVKISHLGHQQLDSPALSDVSIEVNVDLYRLSGSARREWANLQQHDVVFLVKLQPLDGQAMDDSNSDVSNSLLSNCMVRGLVVNAPDELRDNVACKNPMLTRSTMTLSGQLDSLQFYYDSEGKRKNLDDVFCGFNVVVRRRSELNNFFPVLSSLQELLLSEDQVLPQWLDNLFLGRSTLSSTVSDQETPANSTEIVDFADTFISAQHVKLSFPSFRADIQDIQTSSEGYKKGRVGYRITFKSSDTGNHVLNAKPYLLQARNKICSAVNLLNTNCLNKIEFNVNQIEAIRSGLKPGLTLIAGPPGTGKTSCIVQIASSLYMSQPHERILIITRTNHALNDLVERLLLRGVDPMRILRLGQGASEVVADEPLSKAGRVDALLEMRLRLLSKVALVAKTMTPFLPDNCNWSCESSHTYYKSFIEPEWARFMDSDDQDWKSFPFKEVIEKLTSDGDGTQWDTLTSEDRGHDPVKAYRLVSAIFDDLEALRFLEVLRTSRQRGNYLVTSHASIVAMTCVHAAMQRRDLVSQSFTYDTLIMEEAAECLEVEAFLSLLLQKTGRLKRVVLVGDHKQLPPVVQDSALQQRSNLGQSLFARLVRLGNRVIQLDCQGRSRPSLADLFRWRYSKLVDMDFIRQGPSFAEANPGFLHTAQFIDTGELSSESQPLPHFYQNVAEAEYIAFTFLYMRMLGYPADQIAVLTTYNGQVQLLKEVISGRSAQHGNLGNPSMISTIDKFQGRQADYVLLSLVRTKSLGHFRDVRRITVAMSRARFGVYMFGYLPLFSSSTEFRPVLSQLKGGHQLALIADETFSKRTRQESDSSGSFTSAVREVHSPADMAAIVAHLHETMQKT